jgi:DNA-directed RNA polymerase subunit RPC12/RpoP
MAGALVLMFAIAGAIGVMLTVIGWRHPTPNVYDCQQCGQMFRRAGADGYPTRCPLCSSARWNLPRESGTTPG